VGKVRVERSMSICGLLRGLSNVLDTTWCAGLIKILLSQMISCYKGLILAMW